ncbi:DUF3939 domain-containing protein [Paenibacillus soyae]|uniref:DUF3939 domain-containing protein n=1 Tax=Paenibacillus soyae TaxID=2969249 RepID=A0A9X2MJK5_9BACL|nr:DUF3939 domain-containing protein [Paenibacillus soyae]MCR2803023.1 DUF3939 domain-containing protein [Paenibacillus soyae]
MKSWMKSAARRSGYRAAASAIMLAAMMTLLSGCLYPEENLKQNVPPKEAVRNVQAAIDQYFEEKGLLPISNSDQDVPKYEKFKLDFKKLQSTGYLSAIPTAAFENGGTYFFLIMDEETDPTVKLMDIVTYQRINDVQKWVKEYRDSRGALPQGDEMYPGFYTIDYESMGRKAPELRSVFSGTMLSAIMDKNGLVYTDYGVDIMQLMQKNADLQAAEDTDLREWLADASDFVPVKAPEYRLRNGEPVAVLP